MGRFERGGWGRKVELLEYVTAVEVESRKERLWYWEGKRCEGSSD